MKMDSSEYLRKQIAYVIGFIVVGIMAMCVVAVAFDFSDIAVRLIAMYLPSIVILLFYAGLCRTFCQISKVWIENGCIHSKPVFKYHRDFVRITIAMIIYVSGSLLFEMIIGFKVHFVLYIMGVFDLCIAGYLIICWIDVLVRMHKSKYITDDDLNDPDVKTVYSDRYIFFQIVSGVESMYSGMKKRLLISNEPFERYPDQGYRTLLSIERYANNTESLIFAPYDKSILQLIKKSQQQGCSTNSTV